MTQANQKITNECPLCVDLDGTLLLTDSLHESFLQLLRNNPLVAITTLSSLLRGKSYFKAAVASHICLEVHSLPYSEKLLEWLHEEHKEGRRLVLATAANQKIAKRVAEHLGIFDKVLASTTDHNLKGTNKSAVLVELYGKQGFDYIGDSRADLAIFLAARRGYLCGSPPLLKRRRGGTNVKLFDNSQNSRLKSLLKALRPHQWSKNLLLFLPLIAAHAFSWTVISKTLLAFLVFSLLASAVYLLNDLLDLTADRQHPRKRRRPFAAGELPLSWGMLGSSLLALTGLLLSGLLGKSFTLIMLCYLSLTNLYSLWLKRKPILDVVVLAGLYDVRVLAGALAGGIIMSPWLLSFSLFLFVSLAFVKRVTELQDLRKREELATRGYFISDLDQLSNFGATSGYITVMVLALYINSPAVDSLYAFPDILWLICPILLYWISRVWLITHRGAMDDDPVLFALKDRVSWGCILTTLLIVTLSEFVGNI